MFQRFQALREQRDERGFTLIELLVVILIIAILAAIAIPVFLNQRERGWVAQSQSALKNAATAAESFGTQNNGSYATLDSQAELVTEGYSVQTGVTVDVSGDASGYCIQAIHASLGTDAWATSSYDSDDGEPATGDNCTPAV
jgi:type IV pilus assembly protein PilA